MSLREYRALLKAVPYGIFAAAMAVIVTVLNFIMFREILWPDGPMSYMPRGGCMRWDPRLVWWHAATDVLIWLAYTAMPVMVAFAVWFELRVTANPQHRWHALARTGMSLLEKIRYESGMPWGARLRSVAVYAAAFIFFCGNGHLIDLLTIWHAAPWVKAVNNTGTAITSWAAGIAIIRHFPYFAKLIRQAAAIEQESGSL